MILTILILSSLTLLVSCGALIYMVTKQRKVIDQLYDGLTIVHVDTERSAVHSLTNDLKAMTETIYTLLDNENYRALSAVTKAYDELANCLETEYDVQIGTRAQDIVREYQTGDFEDDDE